MKQIDQMHLLWFGLFLFMLCAPISIEVYLGARALTCKFNTYHNRYAEREFMKCSLIFPRRMNFPSASEFCRRPKKNVNRKTNATCMGEMVVALNRCIGATFAYGLILKNTHQWQPNSKWFDKISIAKIKLVDNDRHVRATLGSRCVALLVCIYYIFTIKYIDEVIHQF